MLRSITAKEFITWECYQELEPFGDTRADWLAASIREVIYNMSVEPNQRLPLKDFLVEFKDFEDVAKEAAKAPPRQAWQTQLAIARMLAAAQAEALKKRPVKKPR